jgi:predicted ATPase/class 3 adenylate cyclase
MMDFYEVVDQAIKLLQQRGRLTYRSLKVQFQLDDETLEALKEEILYSQPQVVDDEGKGLIWTGEAAMKPASTSTRPAQPEVTQQDQSTVAESPPTEHRSPEAERRQLTVMFCDLVDSTRLSSQLDPEDYRDVVREYQRVCAEVIIRFDGHIAQYLGDGLLVYFGYPVAHEEDAQRAIHSGLGIVAAIKTLSTQLEQEKGIRLTVRLGIHTGLVVVGEIGRGGRQEQLALGEVPNVASRIQGIAHPDTVMMSADTYRLVQGFFECEPLGEQVLRGVSQPLAVYRVLSESGAQSRLDVASTRGLTPLVGREQEVGLLIERWEQAKDGQGQVILLSGEAGIGKSRLVQVLKDHVANEPHTRWECRSSPYYQNTALYPLIDLLQRALQWQQDDSPNERLKKLEHLLSQYRLPLAETIPLFAPLLSLSVPEDRYPPLNFSPQRQRQKTLESIVAMLLELAEREPVLFILEDLHWTDPTTLEFLGLLVEQIPTAAIYTLLTCRPHFQPSWHHRSYLTEITVNRLSRNQIEQMAQHVAGEKTLPTEIIQQLVDKTDGVPLYVEEMTKMVLELGTLKEVDGQYALIGSLSSLVIPATLQDSLTARLDGLLTAKGIAQLGATIGRQFSYSLLQALVHVDAQTLQRALGRLVEAELLYQRGLPPYATYTFKHALIQDAAYQSLLRSTRQEYHQRIGHVLEARFPEIVETQPELLAYHYTQAGLFPQAIPYWQRAGQRAIQGSAYVEAIMHLTKGLELLATLPETPERPQHELLLQVTLGPALMATKGWFAPEVERVYLRAGELCQQVGETPHLFPVLYGLCAGYFTGGKLPQALEVAEAFVHAAQRQDDVVPLLVAHRVLGTTLHYMGAFASARPHFEQCLALYDLQRHRSLALQYAQDPGVAGGGHLATTLWLLGYPDQALEKVRDALALARHLSHPHSLAYALANVIRVYRFRAGEGAAGLQELHEELISLATEHRFAHRLSQGTVYQGWMCVLQGRVEEGIAMMRQGLAAVRNSGAGNLPRQLALLAEAYGIAGQTDKGLSTLDEALDLVHQTEERWWEAELYRLRGELLRKATGGMQSAEWTPEVCFHQALDVARHQQAKSLELRAAMSLSRLWQSQGKRQEAYNLLAPVYNWFTEGFDTMDLQEAKRLLEELEA